MSTPILATKLFIPPPRPSAIPRPRLTARLNEGLQRKLTLLSAPAGFGKTTVVGEWLAGCGQPAAWLSLDAGDSEPTRFLAYLVAALQTIAPMVGAALADALQSPQPPPIEAALTTLLNDLAALPDHTILVFDDVHVLASQSIDHVLSFLLEHLPPQLHLVITTREDPQLPLARLRARDQLVELRAADLRFTPAEAAGFLNNVMALNLPAAHIAALEARTEGWIAGLQLAALSMRGREDVARFVRDFAGDNRYIIDYLVEEVLQRQPERVRSFLLQTAILDRLSGPLCNAVTGQHDGVALLDALERANLFVVPLDDRRHWFRYHHLFGEVLAAYALQEHPEHIPALHRRASIWYADHALPADAIRHALAAQDVRRAAGLVELAWPEMDGRFQTATWLGWARALPDELVRARPVLATAYAWALLNAGDLEAAEARLGAAEQSLAQADRSVAAPELPPNGERVIVDERQLQALPASIATAWSYLAQARGDIPGSVAYGRRALDLLPASDHLRRGPAAALLGLAYWASGNLEAAHQALADAMANFQLVGNLHFAISGTYGLADIRTTQGRLREAIRTYAQTLQLALAQGEPLLRGTADLYLGLSELYREQGDRAAALQHLRRSEELGEPAALPDWRYRLYRAQARFKEIEGDLTGALDLLAMAERHYHRTPVPDVRPLAALRARVWIVQGRLDEALEWARERGLAVDDEPSYLREFAHMTLARALIAAYRRAPAQGDIGAALRLLERLQHAAEAGARMGSAIEIAIVQALAHQAQGDRAAALAALDRALRLAEPEGYVRIFVDEGLAMADLLAAAQTRMPGYCAKLLAAFAPAGAAAPPQPVPAHDNHHDNYAGFDGEPLSARELKVLRLLSSELNGPEIARELVVSLNTMRSHTKNIYSKLRVNNRRAAVRRAQALGLL